MNRKEQDKTSKNKIILPDDYNYLAVFLTFACPRTCDCCLNEQGEGLKQRPIVEGERWVDALNRLQTNLTMTFNGGEPLSHPDFYQIVNGLEESVKIDMLTTLPYDPAEFIENLNPVRFERDLHYAAIRVTFHPEAMDLEETIEKVRKIKDAGFDIEINLVMNPKDNRETQLTKERILSARLGCVIKPFLGYLDGTLYGQFKYVGSCEMKSKKNVKCLTTQLLIDPIGDIYRCYGDLFRQNPEGVLGNLFEREVDLRMRHTDCNNFGFCHPCDVQIKLDRLSNWGYTAVQIVGDGVASFESSKIDWG